MSVDLVAFLKARLDEDERTAEQATRGPWRYSPGKEWFVDPDKLRAARSGVPQRGGEEFVGAGPLGATIGVAATGPANHPQSMADARHIARHDPGRVLREIQAMRRILTGYEQSCWGGEADAYAEVVSVLAAVYADHPDYRAEWTP